MFFDKCDCCFLSRTAKNSEIQNTLVSKRSTLLSCNIVNRYKFTPSYPPPLENDDVT